MSFETSSINYNMRCIEIWNKDKRSSCVLPINYNMRCIEIVVRAGSSREIVDKLQHEMY